MKKFILLAIMVLCLTGCQNTTKNWGGSMTIELPKGQKLEEITWKGDSDLWYLTRPMTKDDVAETHVFRESSNFGALEGKVIIVESKE